MRISELSARTSVPVPTIKFYLRERLLPEGARSSATQSDYDEGHERRLRVIRGLLDAGVSLADARRVLAVIDDPPERAHDLLGVAHDATAPKRDEIDDISAAVALAHRLGWEPSWGHAAAVQQLAGALAVLDRAGFAPPDEVVDAYVRAAADIARAEVANIPADSAESAVRYVVLGTVLAEPLLLALRRIAEQVASWERYGDRSSAVIAPDRSADQVRG